MRHPDDGREGASGNGASGNGASGNGASGNGASGNGASGNDASGVPHPDEGTIHAWLDGELPEAGARALTDHLEGCGACRDAVAEARGLLAASARIMRALDDGPGGVRARPAGAPPAAGRPSDDRIAERPVAAAVGGLPAAPAVMAEVRSIESARARRSGAAPHRWRLPAIAAVGLMAVGTTLVLQRGGPPPPLAEQGATAAAGADVRSEAAPAPSASEARKSTDQSAASGAAGQQEPAAAGGAGAAATAGGTVDEPDRAGRKLPTAPPVAASPQQPRVADAAAAGRSAHSDSDLARSATALSAPAGAAARRFAQSETVGVAAPAVVMPPSPDVARAVGPVLTGRVVSGDGRPVPSARVTLPGVAQVAVTDSQGRFRIAGLPTGEHVAVVQGLGFEPRRLPLHVVPAGDSVVTVALVEAVPVTLSDVVVSGAEPSRRAVAARGRAPAPTTAPTVSAQAPSPPMPVTAPTPPSVAAAVPGALAQRLAGCYRLELGGEASAGRDSAEVALPGWLHLLATPSARRPGWLRVEPLLLTRSPAAGSTGWRVGADDEVEVVWPTADPGSEVVLRLRGAGEVLTGTAALRRTGSGAGAEREAASVVAFRGACAR